jgi:hypothetical protein
MEYALLLVGVLVLSLNMMKIVGTQTNHIVDQVFHMESTKGEYKPKQ